MKLKIEYVDGKWILYGWQDWTNGESDWEPLAERKNADAILEVARIYMEEAEK